MAQKRSDLETIPLCRLHHDEQHRIGWKRFIETYQLDIPELLKALQEKPRIWVNRHYSIPWYVADFRSERFYLCPVSNSLLTAIRIAQRIRQEHLIDELFTERREHETLTDALRPGSSDCLG
jgi:hypothetical protein